MSCERKTLNRAARLAERAATIMKWLTAEPEDAAVLKAALVLARQARRYAGELADCLETRLEETGGKERLA